MNKCIRLTSFVTITLIFSLTLSTFPAMSTEVREGHFASLSPGFLSWQEQQKTKSLITNNKSSSSSSTEHISGYVPVPVDLSHLADELPRENSSPVTNNRASLPSTFDLRNVNGKNYVTSVKNQLPYGTCWAFAALGAMESNYLMNTGNTLDLSELHLAWYAFRNSDKSHAFYNEHNKSFASVMEHGGNSFYPTALYSRLSGPVNESELRYTSGQPSSGTPDSYTRTLRLTDVYFLSFAQTNVNNTESARNIVKQRIIENGAVVANYFSDDSLYNKTSSGGTAYYTKTTGATNHAILLVGWDDNYSRSNFKNNPGKDGAWLVKNSWGSSWGDNGYFWLSYANYLTEGSTFEVEAVDNDMKIYYYDALGWTGSYGWDDISDVYAANVFKSERSGETLQDIGLYIPKNNLDYKIDIYKVGNSMPSSSPVKNSPVSSQSGTFAYAGYHTVTLNTPVELNMGEYFSVVVTYKKYSMAPVERYVYDFADNVKIDEGSFFSYDGKSWTTGTKAKSNACIKAFTIADITPKAPTITTNYPPDGVLGVTYSATITASGTKPITWTIIGNIPEGLGINSNTGEIFGTPTKTGSFTFTVTATNQYGSSSRNYTMNINERPRITSTSFSGYAGYKFSATLRATMSRVTWTLNGTLPKGLTLNTSTGEVYGTPTQSGNFTVSFTVSNSAGSDTANVTFTIYAKPTLPKITTSSLSTGTVGASYSQTIRVSGTTPVTIDATGLPNGLDINSDTGNISGTPETSGTFNVTISATNIATNLEGSGPATKTLKLVIKDSAPKISVVSTITGGIVGEVYDGYQFESTAGTSITWTASGIPSGMSLSKSGLLTGTPKKAGTFTIKLKATSTGGKDSASTKIVILQKPTISTKKLANATTDKKYSAKLTAKGTMPITWTVEGLPDTLSLKAVESKGTATIEGIPTEAGTYNVNVMASNSAGDSESMNLTLTVKGVAPKLTTTLAKGKANTSYNGSKISATGTRPIEITYEISSSNQNKFGISDLSDLGLAFTADPENATATITGTSEISIKNLPITFKAVNVVKSVTKTAKLTISGNAPRFTTPSAATVNNTCEPGESVNIDFEVSGTKNITFTAKGLVDGLTFTQTGERTANLSGTAGTKAGKTTVTITAQNSDGKVTKKVVIQTKAASNNATLPDNNTISENLSEPDEVLLVDDLTEPEEFNEDTPDEPEPEPELEQESVNILMSGIPSLSERILQNFEGENLIVAAVLPEVQIFEAGVYDFNVSLDEDVPTGLTLLWRSDPDDRNSEDILFTNNDGAEIHTVPEDHNITASIWLDTGKYSPVILAEMDVVSVSEEQDINDADTPEFTNDTAHTNDEPVNSSGGCNSGFIPAIMIVFAFMKGRKRI